MDDSLRSWDADGASAQRPAGFWIAYEEGMDGQPTGAYMVVIAGEAVEATAKMIVANAFRRDDSPPPERLERIAVDFPMPLADGDPRAGQLSDPLGRHYHGFDVSLGAEVLAGDGRRHRVGRWRR